MFNKSEEMEMEIDVLRVRVVQLEGQVRWLEMHSRPNFEQMILDYFGLEVAREEERLVKKNPKKMVK